MPKLPTAVARQVAKADTNAPGKLVPPGEYLAKLVACKVSPKNDKNNNPYWIWDFELDEGEFKGTKVRTNTGLAENQQWWMKTVFEAFGAKPNVDTDTLVGQQVTLVLDNSEIQGGARKGQLRNEITTLMPPGQGDEGDEEEFEEEDEDAF